MDSYTYEQAVEYLLSIPSFSGKNSFENTKDFISSLGRYEKMKNVIHVAGTNGKGSVCSYVQSVLLKAGYSVGMFTSPHLVSINERIRLNGVEVDNETFRRGFIKVKKHVDKRIKCGHTHPAFFEFVFAMACVIFEEYKPDIIILETGLGGRLDATNVVEKPLVAAITSIGLDHTQYLGDTIEKIAAEKAGIIKEGIPVVYDADIEAAARVIEHKAEINASKVYPVCEKNVKIEKITQKYIDFFIEYGYDKIVCINLKSNAYYQIKNVHIAVTILDLIDNKISIPIMKEGIENTVWRGRMEWIKPYFLIDGAHNMAGIKQAVSSVKGIGKSIVLLFSAVSDKDYSAMIKYICDNLDIEEVIITKLSISRGVDTDKLRKLFEKYYNGNIFVEMDINSAIELAKKHYLNYDNSYILALGSLYLVSEIIASEQ